MYEDAFSGHMVYVDQDTLFLLNDALKQFMKVTDPIKVKVTW